MFVYPSLTRMTALRPSRRPPIRSTSDCSADMLTWLRMRSTTAAGYIAYLSSISFRGR